MEKLPLLATSCDVRSAWLKLQYKYIYQDSKLLAPVVYFAKPDKTSLWAVWAEQQAH